MLGATREVAVVQGMAKVVVANVGAGVVQMSRGSDAVGQGDSVCVSAA